MERHILPVTMFQSNCVIVWDAKTMDGLVFDPGGEPERIVRFIESSGISIKGIFLTHGHVDHVAGTNGVRDATQAKTYLHPADKPLAAQTPQQCTMFGIAMEQAPQIDIELKDDDKFEYGALKFEVLHTPGHSPGSVCFRFLGDHELMVGGDLLFAGSIGRMDLPGGDPQKMKTSLDRVSQLPEATVVIAGHGPETTIGKEKSRNPYLTGGMYLW